MSNDGMTPENRASLIAALSSLADGIEANPPTIIGNDIFLHAAPGANAIGSHISVNVGPNAGRSVGQRISVVAQPGQSVIGQRITLVSGNGPVQPHASGASSQEKIHQAIAQLRDAATALASSPASEGWIKSILNTVTAWGGPALNAVIEGASGALTRFYLTGS